MIRSRSVLFAVTLAAAAALAVPGTATAASDPEPIASGFAGPLQIDVGDHGIYVAQDFIGVLTKIRPDGTTKDLVSLPPGVDGQPSEIAGVASDGYNVVFTSGRLTESGPVTKLQRRFANGTVHTIANLGKFEADNNPDGFQVYGFRHLSQSCIDQLPADFGPPSYTGIVDSHPYAVANAPGGGWYVAEAAGNDILYVSPGGDVSVVKVLRPAKAVVTAEAAEANGLPDCVVGKTYNFEPVPTDVEVNPLGYLIVSELPGGPEDPSLGARGKILRIDPGDGEFSTLAEGLAGATNVAPAPGGKIYVTELFGGRISVVQNHVVTPVADIADPAAVEFSDGLLYAGVNVFADGTVVSIAP
jgi:hypothetical protein